MSQDKALEDGKCFHCDPTAKEEKELSTVLRVVEALGNLEDFSQIDRVCNWAASNARKDLEERHLH